MYFKEEVEHIISLIEESLYKLSSVKYMKKGYWINIYDGEPNRFGVYPSKDFFDIQDYDIRNKEISNFELKFYKLY